MTIMRATANSAAAPSYKANICGIDRKLSQFEYVHHEAIDKVILTRMQELHKNKR